MKAELRFNRTSSHRAFAWLAGCIEQINDNDKDYVIECREYRNRRSLDANAYYWVLINSIVSRLPNVTNDSIHFDMLRAYGPVEVIQVRKDVDISKYGIRYFEEDGGGEKYTYYRVYKGSSQMDSKEMSRLIDGAVQEAKNLGIETLPPAELKALCDSWKGEI